MNEPLSLNRYTYVSNNPVNFIDPTGRWQEGDENLPESSQEQIRDLTDQWYEADTQEERDRIHQEAEDIRNSSGGSSGSGSSGGSGSTMTREEWIAFKALYFNNRAGEISQESLEQLIELIENTPKDDEIGLLNILLDFTHNFTGKEEVGIVGIVNGVEATGILGLNANTGIYLDSKGNYYHLDSGSLVLKSNFEVGVDTKFVIIPYLDDINKLTGIGMSAGLDVSTELGFGISAGLASSDKDSFALTITLGVGIQLVPLADVYLNIGFSELYEYGSIKGEIDEELLELLNKMQLGGY